MKICKICNEQKSLNNFYKSKGMKDGYRNECKSCLRERERNNKERRKELRQEKKIITEGEKVCRICGKIKPMNEFHLKRGTPDGHRSECKECIKDIQKKYKNVSGFKENRKEYDKKRYQEKREQILERKKEYHIENQEKILSYKKVYREENDEQIKEWRKNNPDKLAKCQANYRKKYPHVVAWRSVLYSTLKRLGTSKQSHTIDLLGYSANQLKIHLESMFQDGMTWNNHGEWDIDHIHPVTKFDKFTPISEVCALDNLQPLWKEDNLRKGNRI